LNGLRAIAVALMLAALLGTVARVAAQDADAGTESGGASVYVSVACAFDGATGVSTCEFTPIDESGGPVFGIAVPGDVLCAPLAGGDASSGYYAALPDGFGSASISLFGAVSVGGSATYAVDTAAGQVLAAGGGLVCEAVAPPAPDETIVDEYVDEPVFEDPAPVETGEISEDVAATEDVSIAEDVTVTVYAYDCLSDPNGVNPAEYGDCTPSEGIELSATADGEDAGTQTTDVNGWAAFSAPDGSSFVVAENLSTLPAGYEPYGNGVAFITAEAGSVIVFIHLTEPLVGRLQIVNGSCPTAGETRTEFRVIEPKSVAMAAAPVCAATGGTVFQILGGTLPDGGMWVITDGDGAWRGYLPAGVYTVVDDSTASADVTVIVNDISVVIVVDYVSYPIGVLNVSRFLCETDDENGIVITFFGEEPGVGDDDGCSPVDGSITIDVDSEVSAASVATFDLGPDGVEEIELDPGDYTLTDNGTGATGSFSIQGGTRLYAVVQDLVVSDDGVGNPGGGDPTGGENPGGNPGGNPAPGPNDGTGGNPGNGSGNPTTGGPGGDTDGGVDAGENSGNGDDVAYVTQLPAAGIKSAESGMAAGLSLLLLLASGMVAGAFALRTARRSS